MSRYTTAQWTFASWTFANWTFGGGASAPAVTIYLALPGLAGVSGLSVFLYSPSGVLLNTGGSGLSLISGSGGTFTASVTPSVVAVPYSIARVMEGSTLRAEGSFANGHPVMRNRKIPHLLVSEASRARSRQPVLRVVTG